MAVGNRFKTNLATAMNKFIDGTQFLKGALSGGVAQLANEKWVDFDDTGIRRKEMLAQHSVAGSLMRPNTNGTPGNVIGGRFNPYANVLYASLDAEKANRIYEYRLMASFPEVNEAIDKICNQFLHEDERGNVVKFKYLDEDLPSEYLKDIEDEWDNYIRLFDLRRRGRRMCYDYLVDGEVYMEFIMANDTESHKKRGIIGVSRFQTELMETVYKDKCNGIVGAFVGRVVTFNENSPQQIVDMEYVPFHPNQVFYVSSGNFDPTGEWIVPYIERARKRYIQLSYLEDAIVIYRLVRAPERLVFTVDTGNMPAPQAEAYLRSLQQSYWKQKTFDINKGDIMQKFEPQSMLDAFWVAKGQGNEGVQITPLAGGQNLGQLEDLNYFIKALYRALQVPTNYVDPAAQTSADQSSILREELDFAEFIMSIQKRFEEPLIEGFVTHLKLQGKWQQYNLREHDIQVQFNPPSSYYEMRKRQAWDLAINSLSTAAGIEQFSKMWLMKHLLNLTNEEIMDNVKLRKLEAAHEWEIAQIQQAGPLWKQQVLTDLAGGAAEAAGGGEGGAGGGDFGGGPGGGDFGGGGEDFGGAFDDAGFSDDDMGEMEDAGADAADALGMDEDGAE